MSARASVVLAIVAAFLFGCTAGVWGGMIAMHWVRWHGMPRYEHSGSGPRPMLRHLEERLDLDPGQQRAFEQVLERSRQRIATERESTEAGLERVLTPDQLRRWREMEPRFGPPGGHHRRPHPDGPDGGPGPPGPP